MTCGPGRIKAIERAYLVARLAIDRLLTQVQADPTILVGDVKPRDLGPAREVLEGTYAIRLFAEFETGLRSYWKMDLGRRTRPNTGNLLDAIASRRRIEATLIARAHAARAYRNSLVHERGESIPIVTITDVRATLCAFLGRLPENWSPG